MTNQAGQKSFYVPSPGYLIDDEPFKNDLLQRKALAQRLTSYVDGLRSGCVIGIDAPWGEGKTYFGRNWQTQLTSEGYKTIYLDAFEQDYREDPFLVIAAEIAAAIKKDEGESWIKFSNAFAKAGKALLPTATKLTVNLLGKMVLGTCDVSEELIETWEKKAGEVSEGFMKARLREYEEEKKSLVHFREQLHDFAAGQGEKPVVFFVDELDRCRPAFAVEVIERIKHFFDIPNLVFVLLLNREQLEESVRGVYGPDLNAHAYLGKFVHFFLTLPKHLPIESSSRNFNYRYCEELATNRYKFSLTHAMVALIGSLAIFSSIWKLSLRDLERVFIYLALGRDLINTAPHLVAYLCCLKVHDPSRFHGIALNDIGSHMAALSEFTKSKVELEGNCWQIEGIIALHKRYTSPETDLDASERESLVSLLDGQPSRRESLLTFIASRIDTILVE